MDAFLLGLESLLQPAVLLAIVIGSVGGVVIGAVPGIGPAIAIAILLPATVFLDDLVSLVLLLGIYGSSMYGGAIPAILINTPGTPVNALTTYDGYAMTRRGAPSRALSLAYSASFFGGCFSIAAALIALFAFGPYLRDLGALFGQRDILMAAILGAVLLIAAHRKTMAIAAMLFGFGFLIAMIGRQTTRKIDRFTFDIEYLYSGFNLIVVIVGIFALSQALNLMVGKDDDPPEARISGGLFTGFKDLISHKLTAIISACYGTVMGIIPGVGEFVAQFFSYSTARAISKDPARFGHGSPEGLLASETSNNAVPAAAMIPLLALGVPGEALTAMMMVVFFDAGIKPGPDIFVGVYSIRNSFADCIFAVIFGYIGFILRRLDWPLVPIVLGLVLGSIILERLTAGAGQIKTALDLINRPVSGTLFVVILMVMGFIIWTSIRNRRKHFQ